MLCSEASMVNTGWDGIQAVSLRCRAWTCPLCAESRRKQLVALALSGQPTTFITLTVATSYAGTHYEQARALADAWRVIVRRAKAKYGYGDIPYLCVFEATKAGTPHLHILCRVAWVGKRWLSDQMKTLMASPIVDIQRVHNKKKLAFYISKYIGKDPHRFKTCKRYWTTRGYELTKFKPEPPPGRWHSQWNLVRTPLSALANEWRLLYPDLQESRHRLLVSWHGPPDDVISDAKVLLIRRRMGKPW